MKAVQECSELVNNDMSDLNVHLNKLKQVLYIHVLQLHIYVHVTGYFVVTD